MVSGQRRRLGVGERHIRLDDLDGADVVTSQDDSLRAVIAVGPPLDAHQRAAIPPDALEPRQLPSMRFAERDRGSALEIHARDAGRMRHVDHVVIDWREADDHILMTGPFALDYEGTLPPELLTPLQTSR